MAAMESGVATIYARRLRSLRDKWPAPSPRPPPPLQPLVFPHAAGAGPSQGQGARTQRQRQRAGRLGALRSRAAAAAPLAASAGGEPPCRVRAKEGKKVDEAAAPRP